MSWERVERWINRGATIALVIFAVVIAANAVIYADPLAALVAALFWAGAIWLWFQPPSPRPGDLGARVYHGHPTSAASIRRRDRVIDFLTEQAVRGDLDRHRLSAMFAGHDGAALAAIHARVRHYQVDPAESTDVDLLDDTGADDPWRSRADREWLDDFVGRVRALLD